jgi:transcriptional regulator with XRE-family HTH domain
MGKRSRSKPERLAEKLLQIRVALGLSQTEMHRRLGLEEEVEYTIISKYELGRNEPPLTTLLRYARVAGVHLEDIVDDDLDLPERLPGNVRYQGIRRSSKSQKKRSL